MLLEAPRLPPTLWCGWTILAQLLKDPAELSFTTQNAVRDGLMHDFWKRKLKIIFSLWDFNKLLKKMSSDANKLIQIHILKPAPSRAVMWLDSESTNPYNNNKSKFKSIRPMSISRNHLKNYKNLTNINVVRHWSVTENNTSVAKCSFKWHAIMEEDIML